MISAETAGLAPMVSAMATPAAVVDPDGRFVVVNTPFAMLFPRLMPTDGWLVGDDGQQTPGTTPQHELCLGCGHLSEFELAVIDRPVGLDRPGGPGATILVSCGVGAGRGALEVELRERLSDSDEYVVQLDDHGAVQFASGSLEPLVGVSACGQHVTTLFDARDRQAIGDLLDETRSNPGTRVVARSRLRGSTLWAEVSARSVDDGVVGVVMGLRIPRRASGTTLGVVATSIDRPAGDLPDAQEMPDAAPGPGPAELVEMFRALSPADKAAVIRALRDPDDVGR